MRLYDCEQNAQEEVIDSGQQMIRRVSEKKFEGINMND